MSEPVFMPSMILTGGLPEGWTATQDPSDFGTPTVADGVIHFDWSSVPEGSAGRCGYVIGGGASGNAPDSEIYANWTYNMARPEPGGHVAFTVTIPPVGLKEQVSFEWRVGSLVWRIDTGRDLNQQWCIAPATESPTFPWTGSCSYNLWFPDGVNEIVGPARLDFSGGGSIWMLDYWFNRYDHFSPQFYSGPASTLPSIPWPGPGFPLPPNDPKTAECFVSGLSIEAWDPTTGVPPFSYPWAVATEAGWHGTYNKAASVYGYDEEFGEIIYDWSTTYPVRLA